jgi:hypothetical protein
MKMQINKFPAFGNDIATGTVRRCLPRQGARRMQVRQDFLAIARI